MMNSEEFTGRSAEMRTDTNWLSSEDLLDLGDEHGNIEVEIEKVWLNQNVRLQEGRSMDKLWSIQFKGARRQLLLNNVNRRTLLEIAGTTDTRKWIGLRVKLYVDRHVKFAGKRVMGIRIRPKGWTPDGQGPASLPMGRNE